MQVRTVPAPRSALPQRILSWCLARLGLADARLDQRWIWLIATSILALIAAGWLVATLLSDPELPGPGKPAKLAPMDTLG